MATCKTYLEFEDEENQYLLQEIRKLNDHELILWKVKEENKEYIGDPKNNDWIVRKPCSRNVLLKWRDKNDTI